MKMVNGNKSRFSFRKCSPFQFVKRKVHRWIRSPKGAIEKGQRAGFLYSNPHCALEPELWYTTLPPYSCCHLGHGCCLQGEPPAEQEKPKGCKVRKWKMLSRHHGDGKVKAGCRELRDLPGCPWALRTVPLLATPVMMECCVCSGPAVTYASEEAWQPRERTQAVELCYPCVSELRYCCAADSGKKPFHSDYCFLWC